MAEELKRCDCGTWNDPSAEDCSACGAAIPTGDVRPVPRSTPRREMPAPVAAAPADCLSAEQIVRLGARRVTFMRWEDGVLGALFLLLGLRLFAIPRMVPYAVIGAITGLVNLALAASLGPGASEVGRMHRWCSYLGIVAGAAVILALVLLEPGRNPGDSDPLTRVLDLAPWVTLALLVLPVLIFPIRALEALSRIEVRTYLGMMAPSATPIPISTVRGQSKAAGRAAAVMAAVSASLGCVSLLVLGAIGLVALYCVIQVFQMMRGSHGH